MRCLVLGGAGFLGSYLCEELLLAGHSVAILEKEAADIANIIHNNG